MKVLAIETSTQASSVALGDGEELAAMSLQVNRRNHVGFLVPAIDFCFERAGWKPSELDAIAVDVGPGPYTGLRAGLATAQGIAAAVGVPLVIASSLTVLALRAATGRRTIYPIVDVRRGQVATAAFKPVPGGVVQDSTAEVLAPEELSAMIDSSPDDALLVGDVACLPDGFVRGLHRVKVGRPRFPGADVLLEIAAIKLANDDVVGPEDVRPLYMREPDAKINWTDFRDEGVWPGDAS
jgi:tRNA threonylcarbamoyl adenosine modification protein YeaZ